MEPKTKSLPAQIIDTVKGGDLRLLRSLLTDNPEQTSWNTPFGGQTWLGYAASKGKVDVMRLLIELGSDVNQGDHRDAIKPICSAASCDQMGAVVLLLENGARLDTETSVQNPLFSAIVGRSPRIVERLLESGIDSTVRYNSRTMRNVDAVAFALMRGERECAHILANWICKGNDSGARALLKDATKIAMQNAHR